MRVRVASRRWLGSVRPLGPRTDDGAVAVLVAILALALLGVGAFAVDLGQVYAKRSALQSNVDMAVLAAAAEIDGSNTCTAEAVSEAGRYLTMDSNQVADQLAVDLTGTPGDSDGFIRCTGWRVELWAPQVEVEFGLAKALSEDNDGVNVPAFAAAEIKSPSGLAGLPMYGVAGCDYGSQIIRDDSGPAATPPPVPPLTPNSSTYNDAEFTISPETSAVTTATVAMTLTGSNLNGADGVGFTAAGGPPDHYVVPAADLDIASDGSTIKLDVPGGVLAQDEMWFVRVLKGAEWSEEQEAQRFNVGEPRLYCASSVEGNFGTLNIPRTDTNSFELEWNIIKGVDPDLDIHPSPAGECGGDPSPTVESTSVTGPVDGTNCIETEPGLKIAQTNAGLISGRGGLPGRLDADTTPGCSRNEDDARTPSSIGSKYLNDDVLSCFITNGARVSDLVAGNEIGTNALSAEILKSPRYFYIPVVDAEPFTGTKSWPIIGFRPGFVTDQPLSATKESPGSVSALNGIDAAPSGLRSLNVILFDEKALPETAPALGGERDYIGSGTKILVLVE